MNILKDLLRGKSTEPQAPVIEPDKPSPKPANALEQTVNEALPVPVQLKKTEDQLRQESLQTMTYLEAARKEKGNFCLTLGEGDERAVLLAAPVEGIKVEDFVKSKGMPDYTYTATRTDYVLLTAKGPRRISFLQFDPSPLYQEGKLLKSHNDQETQEEGKFRKIIDQLVKKGEVNPRNGKYQEWMSGNGDVEVTFSIDIPGSTSSSDNFRRHTTCRRENEFVNFNVSGVITDDATPVQALRNSLNSVQSPLQARMASARAQIESVNALKQGLK